MLVQLKKRFIRMKRQWVDPKRILSQLARDLDKTNKVRIRLNAHFDRATNKIPYDYLINAAGSYADVIAKQFGIGDEFILMPFKGIYRKLKAEHRDFVNGNIYPVPNIKNPFLGVHFTKSAAGEVYLGPTAIPAFGRENYGILKGIDREAFPLAYRDLVLMFRNAKFRQVALTEPKKYFKRSFFKDARRLVKTLDPSWLENTNKVGIRPQLINWKTKELVMDFLVETGDHSLHILNAISPAFTSSMAFSQHLVNSVISKNLAVTR